MSNPLDLWQILRPVLDEYVVEAVSGMHDPDFEWEADHIDCLKDYADVVEAMANWLFREEPRPDSSSYPGDSKGEAFAHGAWMERRLLRRRLLAEAGDVRKFIEESFNP